MEVNDTGTLDIGSETPCPVCGTDLGYYAEFGEEVECESCHTKLLITHRTEFDFIVKKVGTPNKLPEE